MSVLSLAQTAQAQTCSGGFGPSQTWITSTEERTWNGTIQERRGTFFADVTNDGRADLIVANAVQFNSVYVWRAQPSTAPGGAGSFSTTRQVWSLNNPNDVTGANIYFADVTGDGIADAIQAAGRRVVVSISSGSDFFVNTTNSMNGSWTNEDVRGSRGTYFADVNGDSTADLIAINDDGVYVRLSRLVFQRSERWTPGAYWGSRGTFFTDVDGDGKADATVVNNDAAVVRVSTGSRFASREESTWDPTSRSVGRPTIGFNVGWPDAFYGSIGTYFADVNGDGRADAIALNPDRIAVRFATLANAFAPTSFLTSDAFTGTEGTYFADVTGDRKADAIAVNSRNVIVRPAC